MNKEYRSLPQMVHVEWQDKSQTVVITSNKENGDDYNQKKCDNLQYQAAQVTNKDIPGNRCNTAEEHAECLRKLTELKLRRKALQLQNFRRQVQSRVSTAATSTKSISKIGIKTNKNCGKQSTSLNTIEKGDISNNDASNSMKKSRRNSNRSRSSHTTSKKTGLKNQHNTRHQSAAAKRFADARKQRAVQDRIHAREKHAAGKLELERQKEKSRIMAERFRATERAKEALSIANATLLEKKAEIEEEIRLNKAAKQMKAKQQKRKYDEVIRYIHGLRSLIYDRCVKLGCGVPVVCSCTMTDEIQDRIGKRGHEGAMPSFEKCSNNCAFYKNPYLYGKTLRCIWKAMQESQEL